MTTDKVQSVNNSSPLKIESVDSTNSVMRPVVIWGPSGAGKSTLLRRLIQEHRNLLGFTVSHTTRKPREGEIDGKDYHFTERNVMEKAIEAGEFIEYTEFSGNLYGTSKKAMERVQKDGKICVLDLEMEGVKNIKKLNLNALFIFIKPPSLEVLEKRLRARATESDENINRRLKRAKEDLSIEGIERYFDLTIVNDDIDEAYAALNNVVRKIFMYSKSRKIAKPCTCSETTKRDAAVDFFSSQKLRKVKPSIDCVCRPCNGIDALRNEIAVDLSETIISDADKLQELEKSRVYLKKNLKEAEASLRNFISQKQIQSI